MMKKAIHIIFALFLSLLIVWIGGGVSFVQYQCAKCAKSDKRASLFSIVQVKECGGCSCGCAEETKTCSCSSKKKTPTKVSKIVNSDTEKSFDGLLASLYLGQAMDDSSDSCSASRIEKIAVPTLNTILHIDNIALPVIQLLFDVGFPSDLFALSISRKERVFNDPIHQRRQPRSFLNEICILLI